MSRGTLPPMRRGIVLRRPPDIRAVTGLQLPGVIDELCFHDGPLGARVSGEGTSMAVWAPTAQQVKLERINSETIVFHCFEKLCS